MPGTTANDWVGGVKVDLQRPVGNGGAAVGLRAACTSPTHVYSAPTTTRKFAMFPAHCVSKGALGSYPPT